MTVSTKMPSIMEMKAEGLGIKASLNHRMELEASLRFYYTGFHSPLQTAIVHALLKIWN